MPKQNHQPGIHLKQVQHVRGPGEYYWILISNNGRTIARSSETYKRKSSAVRSIEIVANHFEQNQHYYDHTNGAGDQVVYSLK